MCKVERRRNDKNVKSNKLKGNREVKERKKTGGKTLEFIYFYIKYMEVRISKYLCGEGKRIECVLLFHKHTHTER